MAEDWNKIAIELGFTSEKHMLEDFYIREHLPVARIALKLGAGPATILRRLAINGINRRMRGGANNVARLRILLHRMDQRIVMHAPIDFVAHAINSCTSTVYKYRKGVTEGGLLYNQPDVGSTPVFPEEQAPFRPATRKE